MCVCVCVGGGGVSVGGRQEGYVYCCDNLYYGLKKVQYVYLLL